MTGSTSDSILVTGSLPVTNKQKVPVTSKGFCSSDTVALFEAFSKQASLVLFNGTIIMFLNFETTLGVNDINTQLRRNQTPSVIFLEERGTLDPW